ncbi:hypothetical protein [Flavobacterium franklandianum]|uniref:hypothetical protein n=1 Tax=Flavobacterium franklandianum TaxID=2594430 RepID=UPI001C3FE884|nr:hypothetical protein [Flavobacterium franklandianum]
MANKRTIIKIPTPTPASNIPFTIEQLVTDINIIRSSTNLVILSFIISWFYILIGFVKLS